MSSAASRSSPPCATLAYGGSGQGELILTVADMRLDGQQPSSAAVIEGVERIAALLPRHQVTTTQTAQVAPAPVVGKPLDDNAE